MAEPAPGGQALLQHVAGLAGDWPGKGAGDHGPGQREVGLDQTVWSAASSRETIDTRPGSVTLSWCRVGLDTG